MNGSHFLDHPVVCSLCMQASKKAEQKQIYFQQEVSNEHGENVSI